MSEYILQHTDLILGSAMQAKFLDGSIWVIADDWPNFLYEEGAYDPNELNKGLLRGYFLLCVCSFFLYLSLAKHALRYTDTFSPHLPPHLRIHLDQMQHVLEMLGYTRW